MFHPLHLLLFSLSLSFLGFASAFPTVEERATKLQWQNCSTEYGFPAGFECTQLEVPVSWKDPKGPQMKVFINKVPATNAKKRLGSLILNPVGPGEPATDFVASFVRSATGRGATANLREHFDLLGPDPRGFGLSAPTICDPSLWNQRISPLPQNEHDFNVLKAHWRSIGLDCMKRTGPSFNHSDTISAVHDLEAIRMALGEGKLNYMGFSYGTQLGAQYAELFPENIRAMVLDAVTDHSVEAVDFAASSMRDLETVFEHFIDWASHNETSALHGQNVTGLVQDLFAVATKQPIPALGCKQDMSSPAPCQADVSAEELRTNMQTYVSAPSTWAYLTEALSQAIEGNATLLSKTWYTTPSNLDFSTAAISCQDWTFEYTWPEWVNRDSLLRSVSPLLQGVSQISVAQAICLNWPSPVVNPEKPINITHASTNILLVNALWDPQTPYEWAVNLQRQIKGSVLLTRRGNGHTSYEDYGDTSIAMERYLVNLTVPATGTVYET